MTERRRTDLTAKGRKTPLTTHSLHVCSQAAATGLSQQVAPDRRGRKNRQIWNDAPVELSLATPASSPNAFLSPAEEFGRMKGLLKLSKQFFQIIHDRSGQVPPVMAFERWLSRNKFQEDMSDMEVLDPVIPCQVGVDEILVDDLVRVMIPRPDAEKIAKEFSEASRTMAQNLQSAPPKNSQKVQVVSHKHTLDVTYQQKLLKINHAHYDKLRLLFRRHSGLWQDDVDEWTEAQSQRFHDALFVLLARYHGIQGHGYQAACGEKVFEVMADHYGVNFECFGSPLNSYFSRYCSAYPDTDWCFGSMGSFFQFRPKQGSFECNPPFIPTIMLAAVDHIEDLLRTSESQPTGNGLTFVIVVPGWLDDPAIIRLSQSSWKTAHYTIARIDHGFCDGAQHQRMDRYRESPFDTFIYILQNTSGATAFPTTPQGEQALRRAMAQTVPSDSAKMRRLKAGRGFGDADGGGGVYKGKKNRKKRAQEAPPQPPAKRSKKKR